MGPLLLFPPRSLSPQRQHEMPASRTPHPQKDHSAKSRVFLKIQSRGSPIPWRTSLTREDRRLRPWALTTHPQTPAGEASGYSPHELQDSAVGPGVSAAKPTATLRRPERPGVAPLPEAVALHTLRARPRWTGRLSPSRRGRAQSHRDAEEPSAMLGG